jgi:hypothetical protein
MIVVSWGGNSCHVVACVSSLVSQKRSAFSREHNKASILHELKACLDCLFWRQVT